MGIYIKGMEMPTSCNECFVKPVFCPSIRGRMGSDTAPYTWIPANYKHDDCPLVPVPPHGRLIDADAVFKRLQKQAMSVWGNGNPRYQIVLEVMDAIRFAPTIIEAEEGET